MIVEKRTYTLKVRARMAEIGEVGLPNLVRSVRLVTELINC